MIVPIFLFLVGGMVAVAFSPIGSAIARRIGGAAPDQDEVEALRGEVAELRAELHELHQRVAQVDELQERVDFAERIMARQREALPGHRE